MMKLRISSKTFAIIVGILAVTFTSCRKEPVLAPGTTQVCFDQQVLPAIKANCASSGCHDGSGELHDLSSYETIKSYVKAGDPNKSKLYNVITAKGFVLTLMPPKPRAQLSVAQINLITIWILQDAQHTTCP